MSIFRIGLNPYGLTYTLGLQGLGTSRTNPAPLGLPGFVRIARDIGARTLELDLRWLTGMNADELARIADEADAAGAVIVCSTWLRHEPDETLDDARRVARMLRASLIRMHLAPVLEGARAAQGDHWPAIVAHARVVLTREAARARDQGLRIGIENHQDFGSEELLTFADEAGDNVGIVLDTGNAFAVGEDPVAFTERVAHRLVHVHLKDYRAQFTDEGFRLVRCALGEGCVPFELMARTIARLTPDLPVTASIELAALEARHIRLFTAEWWHGYPGREAHELAIAIGRLRRRRLDRYDDYRTPWEQEVAPDELAAYERANLEASVRYLQQLGWM